MNIYAMRHGQTNYNIRGLCNDDPTRDVHLTKLGIQQAQDAAEKLKAVPLGLIITSELPRTQQTAEIINQYHQIKITAHSEINDIRSGFDGKPVADYFQAIAQDPLNTKPDGGESVLEHKDRILGFIKWLQHQQEHDVLVIAHEETLRVFAAYFQGIDDAQMHALHIANCKILRFELS